MSDFTDFLAARNRLDSLLGTPKDAESQFIRVAAAGTAGPVDQLVNAGGDAIITNEGITVVNGAITVRNAGSTVVIDGTSDMFKIAGTGTLSGAWPSPAPTAASVDVTVAVPYGAVIALVGPAGQAGASCAMSVDPPSGTVNFALTWAVYSEPLSSTKIAMWCWDHIGYASAWGTYDMRWYILREAGL